MDGWSPGGGVSSRVCLSISFLQGCQDKVPYVCSVGYSTSMWGGAFLSLLVCREREVVEWDGDGLNEVGKRGEGRRWKKKKQEKETRKRRRSGERVMEDDGG